MKRLIVVTVCLLLSACGGGSGGTVTDATAVSASSIFPTDLVVTSPFASASSSNPSISKEVVEELVVEDFATKKEALGAIIGGTATTSCTFTPTLISNPIGNPTCFGPPITLTNHPDAANMNEDDGMGGGDLLLWGKSDGAGGEACAASQVNHLVSVIGGYVDTAVNVFAMMSCIMDVDVISMPAAEADPVDVTDEVSTVITENAITGLTVTSATFEHQADDADGHDVYFFTFSGAYTDGTTTKNINLYLKHVPLDADNTTYRGKISFKYPDSSATVDSGNCDNFGVSTVADAGSVLYNKTSATSLVYRLLSAQHCGADTDPFDDAYDIDTTNTIAADNLDGWANNFQYALFDVNPEDGTGTYTYAWTAGYGAENTRVLNANLTLADDGTGRGCAYAGYGPTISEGSLGSISGMICNWNYNGSDKMQTYVQRQCMVYDATDERYESLPADDADPDRALKISFAPTLTCGDTDGDTSFTYVSEDGTLTNDNATGADRANGLLDFDPVDFYISTFTMPTAPVDVY